MVHQYKLMGKNIVVDGGSAGIHVVDDAAFDVIGMYENSSDAEITAAMLKKYPSETEETLRELLTDIESLKRGGKLFSPDVSEEIPDEKGGVIKALCLHLAHTCNLVCDYCFAAGGRYRGSDALMSLETAKNSIDFLIKNSGARRNLDVDFFGGEPLLNWDVAKETVRYAREIEGAQGKNIRFTLTTNGVRLDDEVTEFCNREISNVVLSLDGRRETHDSRRKTPSGGGSYDIIVPKFKRFVQKRDGEYYIRGTYTSQNKDFLNDILHMADLGFTELAMEPAVSRDGDALGLSASDLPELFEQYEKLAATMAERQKSGNPFTFYHYTLNLEDGPCAYKRSRGCGSGTEYFAVTPDGTLYPCHQFVGEKDFIAGNVSDGVKEGYVFRRTGINARAECKNCWAKLYCSGGCPANAYRSTGDVDGIYAFGCELFKKRLECAIWLKCEEAE